MSQDLEMTAGLSRNNAEAAANADPEVSDRLYQRDTVQRRPRPWYRRFKWQVGMFVLGVGMVVVILVFTIQILVVQKGHKAGIFQGPVSPVSA